LFGGIIVLFFGGVRLTNTKIFKRIALEDVQDSKKGFTSTFIKEGLIGNIIVKHHKKKGPNCEDEACHPE